MGKGFRQSKGPRGWYLLMKTVVYEESEYFEFVTSYFWLDPSEESEIMYLELHWLFSSDNQFENNTKKALGPTEPNESLNSSYP